MKSVPSTRHSAYIRDIFNPYRRYVGPVKRTPVVKASDIEVLGMVRVVRRYSGGRSVQEYFLSDDILKPQGDRLYWLLKYGLVDRTGLPRRRYLIANSCRAFWIATGYESSTYFAKHGPKAYGKVLQLINSWEHNMSHNLHTSIIGAAKEAIAAFVKDMEKEK